MLGTVFIASNSIGALPLLACLFFKSLANHQIFSLFAANPNGYNIMDLSSNAVLVIMLFPFIAGLATFVLLVKPLHFRSIRTVINGMSKIRWNRFFISSSLWLLFSAIYFYIYFRLDPLNFTLNNTSISIIIVAIISLTLVPFQAAFEEVIFRGYLMQGFTVLLGKRWFPLAMTSILFGLMHGLNPEVKEYGFLTMMPQYIVFGLIFGIITILDDGIEAAIGAHAANNAFLCIMITNKSSALQTAALYEQHRIYPWIELVALAAVGLVFILILKLIFGWKSFSLLLSNVEKTVKSDTIH